MTNKAHAADGSCRDGGPDGALGRHDAARPQRRGAGRGVRPRRDDHRALECAHWPEGEVADQILALRCPRGGSVFAAPEAVFQGESAVNDAAMRWTPRLEIWPRCGSERREALQAKH